MLDAAANVIGETPLCWLAAAAAGGGVGLRPMGRISPHPMKTDWTVSFVTDGRSRKAAEIRRGDAIALVFQRDGGETYVAAHGTARLSAEDTDFAQRWRAAYDVYFPTDVDRANAVFVDVAVERLDLWIKGVTPEPFGMTTTTLVRGADGAWGFVKPEEQAG
jgi:general stress protein 26